MRASAFPLRLAMALSLAPVAAAAASSLGTSFFEHDWLLACDNTRTCRAAGFTADAPIAFSLLFERAGGPDTRVTAMLGYVDGEEYAGAANGTPTPKPDGALQLHVDGRPLGTVVPTQHDRPATLSRAQADALLVALRRGAPIAIVDAAGSAWPISNRGATSTLLKMDAVQDRLDTPGALIQRGTRPEASVPPALPRPVLNGPPRLAEARPADALLEGRQDLIDALLDGRDAQVVCGWDDDRIESTSLQVERLDQVNLLVSMACHVPGRFVTGPSWVIRAQPPFEPVLVTRARVFLKHPDAVLEEEMDERLLGRCGSGRSWVWDGTRFVVSREYVTGLCRAMPGGFWHLATFETELR
ncbi:DUF1176 domain-containing protein [Stenotrophomonas sp. TWI1183]|uniref:DUF1176 domain-containing protein n=1 Tax=Stenotrophomonas sp. TWI1183 TaxID=3136799 RepID=UPI00320B078B